MRGGTVVPDPGRDDAAHGVFDRSGSFAPISQARLSRGRFSAIPHHTEATANLPGTHLYAGFSHAHFGHFLLESIVRLWALDGLEAPPDGLVLPARGTMDMEHNLARSLAPVVARFGDGLPVHVINAPTRIDRLILPTPGFGHGPWLDGSDVFRRFAAKRFAQIDVDGSDKLYLSRRGLGKSDQLVDGEAEIEAMMERAGYFIFRPEAYHLEVQLGVIRAARQIVGADGSAFHLVPFAMRRDARVAIFMRRNRRDVMQFLSTQMQAFGQAKPMLIDARTRPLPRTTPAPIALGDLRKQLGDGGFL